MLELVIITLLLVLVLLALIQVLTGRRGESTAAALTARFDALEHGYEKLERTFRDDLKALREELTEVARRDREERAASFKGFGDSLFQVIQGLGQNQKEEASAQREQLSKLTGSVEQKLEAVRSLVDQRLQQIQKDNAERLEQMRATVDEKLQTSLNQRLNDSFKQVSERLEQVHKGLGEMQSLASGVGDLKKVLSNVKTRGGWGEVQLATLLEMLLSPDQYAANVKTRQDSSDVVEFAIRLPGRDDHPSERVWLPIDSKFPLEDYQRLVEAQDSANLEGLAAAASALEQRIRQCAKDISSKYLDPPHTTDFGIMFLPIEGLYAEVLRRPGLVEQIQRDQRIVLAGPTTFAALLNSLQMGFRTLAIEKRSSEVWNLLGAVKTQFGNFGETLRKVKRNIELAGKSIDSATTKTRTIQRKLTAVQELPADQALTMLGAETEDELDEAGQDPGDSLDT